MEAGKGRGGKEACAAWHKTTSSTEKDLKKGKSRSKEKGGSKDAGDLRPYPPEGSWREVQVARGRKTFEVRENDRANKKSRTSEKKDPVVSTKSS